MREDFNRIMEAEIAGLSGSRPPLLLHSCCAPCSSAVLERLYEHFRIVLFYFNPNTHPYEEYVKRGNELPKLLRASGMTDVELIWGDYDPERFYSAARGKELEPEGGARCGDCFTLRLGETAKEAKRLGIERIATTLTVSPHKNAQLINAIGEELAGNEGVSWLHSDFKKKNGYLRSIELSREYEIYRQCWCGCTFSHEAMEH